MKVGRELAGPKSRGRRGRSTSVQGWRECEHQSSRQRRSQDAFALADATATDKEMDKKVEGEATAQVLLARVSYDIES